MSDGVTTAERNYLLLLCSVSLPHPRHPTPIPASSGPAPVRRPVANELESWNGTNRNHIDSFVPQQDLVDSYLPSFQACVEQGKVTSVMCRCAAAATPSLAF